MGPGGIQKGSYEAQKLSQDQRNWLWGQFGHGGQAPVGYGGEGGRGAISGGEAGVSGGGVSDINAIARQMLQLQKEANQPAVEAARASIPTTQAAFAQQKQTLEGEREPLKQRYQSILDELTRKEKVDISAQERTTSREFGRRGIPLSSGIFDVELQEKLSPTRQFYAGQGRDVGLSREDALRQLTGQLGALPIQEQQSLNQINQAIANLEAGASKEAIGNAIILLNMQTQAGFQSAGLALKQRELEASVKRAAEEAAFKERTYGEEQAFKEREFQQVTLPKSIYERGKPYYKTETTGNTQEAAALQSIFGSNLYNPSVAEATGFDWSKFGL